MEQEFQKDIETLMSKKIPLFPIPEDVVISPVFSDDEKPVIKKKKNKKFTPLIIPKGGFHEKSEKNQKVNLGGKRRQEAKKRRIAKTRSKMSR